MKITSLFSVFVLATSVTAQQSFNLLVFSKTAGFRHSSIPNGIAMMQQLGAAHNFTVAATESSDVFSDSSLAQYQVVVFLNTTGDVLNETQQLAFENFIQGGKGFVSIHSASDTEYGWAWYGGLVGAYFASHPAIQQARIDIADHTHPSTDSLPLQWSRTDEWYNFQTNPRPNVNVLATLDESTYTGGTMGNDHPISWYHFYDGGRSWYTGMGHTETTYEEPLFRTHVLGAIEWAAGRRNVVSLGDHGELPPTNFHLFQNHPNPFNPSTVIRFRLPVSSLVTLKVYNVLGQEVATLVNEVKPAGEHHARFDASQLTSGIYLYRLQAEKFVQTRKLVLLR